MGATDVLPYPRRRSSIHLEPLDIRLPGEPIEGSLPIKTFVVSKHPHTSSSIRDSSAAIPKVLKPIRDPPRRSLSPDTQRCRSCEGLKRSRSHSVHPMDKIRRPREAKTRRRVSEESQETTAVFIEKIRRELMKQI